MNNIKIQFVIDYCPKCQNNINLIDCKRCKCFNGWSLDLEVIHCNFKEELHD